jgi:UDP-N-acetyl-D-glucosamine dehydrogenase
MKKVSVVGLGYVGLPTAVTAAEAGFKVNGFDTDTIKTTQLETGSSYVEDVSDIRIQLAKSSGFFQVSSDSVILEGSDIFIVCVPTPLTPDRLPDLSNLEAAVTTISKHLMPGCLLIIESTVAPGTVRNVVLPLVIRNSKLESDQLLISYSPERINPGDQFWDLKTTPKIVAGLNPESLRLAMEFYESFVEKIVPCTSIEIAETAKLLENSYRLINISFINELSKFCTNLGIDVKSVIDAAATKPYGFMPFYPGIGAGGHCIPVDPIYLANAAKAVGAPSRFIELADQINQEMPSYFVGRAEEKLGGLVARKVLVVGVSYKSNVADMRESPVEALIAGLKRKGAQVFWHDDLVKVWNGENSVALSSDFDLAIIATPHDYFDLSKLGNVPILNTRGSI